MYTPYGATEALPVASNSATEVLEETESASRQGAGTCVGRRFDGIEWRVIEIDDGPLVRLEDTNPVSPGAIGELIVKGPVVTSKYVTRTDANALHKIVDPAGGFWHRMGDVGYFDEIGRLWFCGRKAHVVFTSVGPMYSVRCEAIFNQHDHVYRCALVGIGERGRQIPVIVVEPEQGDFPGDASEIAVFEQELRELGALSPLTAEIHRILFRAALPVDTRHNVKINREQLAVWAAGRI